MPYIDKIEYNDNTIIITRPIIQNSNFLYYVEEFNNKNAELNHAFFYTSIDNDSEYNNKLLTQIYLMKSIRGDDFELATAVNKALLRTDIEAGYCIIVGKWCISPQQDDTLNSYLIIEE